MSFDAGGIASQLGLDISPFTQGILQANAIAELFPATVQTFLANPLLGLISIAAKAGSAIKSAFLDIGHAADNMGEVAEKAGVRVEFITGIGAAAKDAGSSVEGLADSIKFLNNNSADAASGNQTTAANFAAIGVSVTDAAGKLKGTEQLFFEVADAIAALPTPAKKTQAAMNLLGRGGTEMIAALNKGSGGLKDFAKQLMNLGGGVDSGLAAIGDKFGTLETIVDAAWNGIKQSVARPILQFVADHFDQIVATVTQVSGQVRAAIAEMMPSLVQMIPTFLDVGSSIISGMIETFKVLTPILQSVAPLLVSMAQILGSVLGPAFKVLGTIIEAVSKPLQVVFDLINKVLGSIGGVVSAVGEAFGFGSSQPSPYTQAAQAKAPEIKAVNIRVDGIDTNAASSQIAQKIQQPLREAVGKQKRQLEAQTAQQFTVRSL